MLSKLCTYAPYAFTRVGARIMLGVSVANSVHGTSPSSRLLRLIFMPAPPPCSPTLCHNSLRLQGTHHTTRDPESSGVLGNIILFVMLFWVVTSFGH